MSKRAIFIYNKNSWRSKAVGVIAIFLPFWFKPPAKLLGLSFFVSRKAALLGFMNYLTWLKNYLQWQDFIMPYVRVCMVAQVANIFVSCILAQPLICDTRSQSQINFQMLTIKIMLVDIACPLPWAQYGVEQEKWKPYHSTNAKTSRSINFGLWSALIDFEKLDIWIIYYLIHSIIIVSCYQLDLFSEVIHNHDDKFITCKRWRANLTDQ